MRFYTNAEVWSGKIYYRGVENGKKVMLKCEYHPSLFVHSNTPTKYRTIHGQYLAKIRPGNIHETRKFVESYTEVDNFTIYGNQKYQYCFIADEFPNDIEFDQSLINVANIDIEVGSDDGFPDPDQATKPITAITVKMNGRFTTFGCGEYKVDRPDVTYIKCHDEFDLIQKFLGWWQSNYPDIITGWNVEAFDIPYLVNRIINLYGQKEAKRLSPWGILTPRQADVGMKLTNSYGILGIAILDYLKLYRWYAPQGRSQESYRLDNIAHVVLGERKLSYEEYGSLHNLYKENFQMFIDYNIKDVDLVDRLDQRYNLIALALTLTYDNKCNFEDIFTQVRMWDVICFNHLKKQNIVIPPITKHEKESAYIGAYVKDPIVGFHEWVASFDVNSEYPSVIMGNNISPETIIEPHDYDTVMKEILSQGITVDDLLYKRIDLSGLKRTNVTMTANGQFYRRDIQGFMPAMVEKMFSDRKEYKKKMLEAKQAYEIETDPSKKVELKNKIGKYDNLQQCKKVSLNSLYGAMGSKYFRFFDLRNAIAVTTTGQLSIRWIENAINGYLRKVLKTDEDYVIAVDTDSVYLRLGSLVDKTFGHTKDIGKTINFMDKVCDTALQPVIDRACAELGDYTNVYKQKIVMKREVLADKAIWTAKKRYILNVHNSEGVAYAKPEKKTMGLELVKSSTPSYCRDKLKEAVNVIFDKDEYAIQEFIRQVREDFAKAPISDIAFPRGLSDLEKWSDSKTVYGTGTPIHVRGALLYNRFLSSNQLTNKYPLIKVGEKIKFIYLKQPNTLQSNVIAFPDGGIPKEFELDGYIDIQTQFEKSFLAPLEIILDSIGWKSEKKASLEDFFK